MGARSASPARLYYHNTTYVRDHKTNSATRRDDSAVDLYDVDGVYRDSD